MDLSRVIENWDRRRAALAAEVVSCLTKSAPPEINLSIPRHTVTALVLRQFAYDPAYKNRSLPIVFADSSRSMAFPVGCLSAGPTAPADGPVLRLGLCSDRHPDLDYVIDLYLMRNKDLGDEPNMAGEEALTFRRTVELLSDSAILNGAQIHVFHTGLEPMVVGFYRGVMTVLRERQRQKLPRTLVVTPWLYALPPTKTSIGPQSPGAKLESYVTSPPWW